MLADRSNIIIMDVINHSFLWNVPGTVVQISDEMHLPSGFQAPSPLFFDSLFLLNPCSHWPFIFSLCHGSSQYLALFYWSQSH